MIVLDCGIELPKAGRNVSHKPTKEDYEQCLANLVEVLGEVTPTVVKHIHSNAYIALRFIGEMKLAGYLKYQRRYAGKMAGESGLQMIEVKVKATPKLLKVPVEEIHRVPNQPVTTFKGKSHVSVRRGVKTRNSLIPQNQDSYEVAKTMRKQGFRINTFVLNILHVKPALLAIEDGWIMYDRCIHYANLYKDTPEFYFPMFLDSRGRMYDETTVGFSPQGADHEKALVIPTYEEPLTEVGYKALLEAAYGCSEQDWSVEEMISHARDPIGTHYIWKKADSKYSYIALAELIMRYHDDPTQPLPAFTPLDGRCSGLQHWSALTRSPAITNRLGMEVKEASDGLDIYEYVGFEWMKTLPIDLQKYATRKAAKVPVMTFGYNATRMTSIEHLSSLFGEVSDWDVDTGAWKVIQEGLKRGETAKLGSDLYNLLREVLKPFVEAVGWLGECSAIINKETILWVTPDGFVGQQKKVIMVDNGIQVRLSDGSTLDVMLKMPTRKPSKRQHASSLSPNIIHSLDATHLRMVARRLEELNLPMVFIHDSFATHSNYRDVLYRLIVEEFIKLYSENYLQTLKDLWESLYNVELPAVPKLGIWDVKTLGDCPTFFA